MNDEQIAALVKNLAGRMGAQALLTPREIVRDFTGLLNILRQNPAESFDSMSEKSMRQTPSASCESGLSTSLRPVSAMEAANGP